MDPANPIGRDGISVITGVAAQRGPEMPAYHLQALGEVNRGVKYFKDPLS